MNKWILCNNDTNYFFSNDKFIKNNLKSILLFYKFNYFNLNKSLKK